MSVGNRIRYARKYRKYTQERLAIEIGSKQNTPHTRIAQYEGEYHNPTNDTLREMAFNGAERGQVIIANEQKNGRGRFWN